MAEKGMNKREICCPRPVTATGRNHKRLLGTYTLSCFGNIALPGLVKCNHDNRHGPCESGSLGDTLYASSQHGNEWTDCPRWVYVVVTNEIECQNIAE